MERYYFKGSLTKLSCCESCFYVITNFTNVMFQGEKKPIS